MAACHLAHLSLQGAAHGDPSQQLHALRARLSEGLAVLVLGQSLRLSNNLVYAEQIELFVDESRPRSIHLIEETTCNDHYDRQILRVTLDRPTNGRAEYPASRCGWQWGVRRN